jgi:hypothetical protein
MKKNIILELDRIKSLMKIIVEQGSADINIDRMAQDQLVDAPDSFGPMDQYNTIKIGEGTKYPVIYPDYNTIIMGDPDPHLKQAVGNISASNFIKDVKIDDNGEEYIIKNGKKYCLPTKTSGFWKLLSNGKFVYQFSNPKNGLIFSMFITPKPSVTLPMLNSDGVPVDETMTGVEAAIRCAGGDNGWGFHYKDGNLFWGKDGKSYDPTNPEHFDNRSTFDEWWDKWGLVVEVVIGLAAAFTGAGLAAFLVEAGIVEGAFATAYVGGSSETILSVVLQAGVEAGLMAPIAKYQWDRGKESDAILSIAFCFLPFLTELGSVQKYIKGGISPNTTKSLSEKFLSNGGSSGIYASKEAYESYLESLTGTELGLWKATVEQLSTKQGADQYKETLKGYLIKNQSKINNTILDHKVWVDQMDDLTAGQFSKKVLNQNIITGKGAIAQLLRIGIPIAGVAIGFTQIYNKLKSMGYNDTQIEKISNKLETSLNNSEYFKGLIKIDSELYQKLVEELIRTKILSDKKIPDSILQNSMSDPELNNLVEQSAIKLIKERPEYSEVFDIPIDVTQEEILTLFKKRILKHLKVNGHENIKFTDEVPFKTYNFTSNKTQNGVVTVKVPTYFKTDLDVLKYDMSGLEITE